MFPGRSWKGTLTSILKKKKHLEIALWDGEDSYSSIKEGVPFREAVSLTLPVLQSRSHRKAALILGDLGKLGLNSQSYSLGEFRASESFPENSWLFNLLVPSIFAPTSVSPIWIPSCYGLNYVSQKKRVKVLTSSNSECDLVWIESLCRSSQVKMKP